MPRALMDKLDWVPELMGNVSRNLEILRRNQKEIFEIKNTVTEMKKAFDGFISRLDGAEEKNLWA